MDVDVAKLSLGMPFYVGDYYIVHPLTVEEIVELGYDNLRKHLRIILIDWNGLETKIPKKEQTEKALYKALKRMYYEDDKFYKSFNEACNIFLKRPLTKNKNESIEAKTYEKVKKFFSTEILGKIQVIIKEQYLLQEKEEEKIVFANDKARKLYERIQRNQKKAEKYEKKGPEFSDYVSSLRWRLRIPKEELLKLTIYELYEGLNRTQLNERIDNLTTGIYSGNIRAESIEDDELRWIKHIELK